MKKSASPTAQKALAQFTELDASSRCIATAILQLAVTLFMGIQSVQNQNDNGNARKED